MQGCATSCSTRSRIANARRSISLSVSVGGRGRGTVGASTRVEGRSGQARADTSSSSSEIRGSRVSQQSSKRRAGRWSGSALVKSETKRAAPLNEVGAVNCCEAAACRALGRRTCAGSQTHRASACATEDLGADMARPLVVRESSWRSWAEVGSLWRGPDQSRSRSTSNPVDSSAPVRDGAGSQLSSCSRALGSRAWERVAGVGSDMFRRVLCKTAICLRPRSRPGCLPATFFATRCHAAAPSVRGLVLGVMHRAACIVSKYTPFRVHTKARPAASHARLQCLASSPPPAL